MSATATPLRRRPVAGRPPGRALREEPPLRGTARERRPPPWRRSPAARESLLLFAVAFAAYFALGHRVVVEQHVVSFDALSRLAHAYFGLYNAPAKLSAVGFIWPPLQTLVFLPVAVVRPLASSLVALPLVSAMFGAGLLVVLNRSFGYLGMRRALRYPLVLLFAVNPMVAFYASNGMAEIVYLFFLAFGLHMFLRWHRERGVQHLVLAGLGLGCGLMARYELLAWIGVLATAIVIALLVQRAGRHRVESSLLLFLGPIAYAAALWLFFCWMIAGDPLAWLDFYRNGSGVSEAEGAALLGVPEIGLPLHPPSDLLGAVGFVAELNWRLFPPALLVLAPLALACIGRRDLVSGVLFACAALNVLVIAGLLTRSGDPGVTELRYNVRAMPVTMIAIGWLFHLARGRGGRLVVWSAAAAALALSLPSTWRAMESYPIQHQERAFLRALSTGEDQEGTVAHRVPIGIAPYREMAEYVATRVRRPDSILVDDAQGFGVMLLSGRPDLFLDRIDAGDRAWERVLRAPRGRVDYVLIASHERCARCVDRIRARYPGALEGAVDWLRPAHANRFFTLFRVARPG